MILQQNLKCLSLLYQMEMRIKKRPSISKTQKQKPLNMTFSTALFPSSQKDINLPPIKRNLRKPLPKIQKSSKTIKQIKQQPLQKIQRKQTQTTLNESIMFQSYYQTMSKGWIKPSDYIKDIKQLNLFESQQNAQQLQISNYEIKLNQKMEKNMQKIDNLFKLTQKWTGILKRALFYLTSQKSNSDKLIEQIKFWRELSKKFDQLEYQFNNQKSKKLTVLMKNSLKTQPEHKKLYQEFMCLKEQVIQKTIPIKKLYLTLEQAIAGSVVRFEESSSILDSLDLLKKILFGFSNLAQTYPMLENRLEIVYKKMDLCLIQKLLAAPLYPKQLANISGLKFRYQLLDHSISFYSNFISIMEENQHRYSSIIERGQYTRKILLNLLQVLCYFQYLYKKKEVLEFSKLFNQDIDYNIYEPQFQTEWEHFMAIVSKSMEKRGYEP